MKKHAFTVEDQAKRSPPEKRNAPLSSKARKTAPSTTWATETFKRIEALRKALDGQRLA